MITPDEIINVHPPAIRDVVEDLRQLIRATVPDAAERAYPGWHSINYRHPSSGYFCGIFPRDDLIDLVFEFGILLPDRDGLLQGNGKQVRSVRFTKAIEIRPEPLRTLLLAGRVLPPDKATKLAMIQSGARLSS